MALRVHEYRLWPSSVVALGHHHRELCVERPPGPQPMPEVPLRTCASCGRKQLQLLKCSRCKAAFYCDAACQRRHWREHRAVCGAAGGGGGGGGVGGG